MTQFLYAVFDRLLLAILILVCLGSVVWFSAAKDPVATTFATHVADILIGALVGIVTGEIKKLSSTTSTTDSTTTSTSAPEK